MNVVAPNQPGRFALTVLDIPDVDRGVGLALLLQTPNGHMWLYDTGTDYPDGGGWHRGVNTGADRIAPLLDELRVEALDGVIISHAHYDHFGGLLWLAGRVPIRRLIDTGYEFAGAADDHYTRELADYTNLREGFRQQPGVYEAKVAGDTLDLDDALEIDVIAPPAGFFHEPNPEGRPANDPAAHYLLNANSLMLRIRHGEVVFLLPGDIEKDDQTQLLLPSVPPEQLACDICIAPGHGLHTAPEFVEATRPKVVVASLFARWMSACTAIPGFEAVGADVYATGLHGDVRVVSDGQGWEVRVAAHA